MSIKISTIFHILIYVILISNRASYSSSSHHQYHHDTCQHWLLSGCSSGKGWEWVCIIRAYSAFSLHRPTSAIVISNIIFIITIIIITTTTTSPPSLLSLSLSLGILHIFSPPTFLQYNSYDMMWRLSRRKIKRSKGQIMGVVTWIMKIISISIKCCPL